MEEENIPMNDFNDRQQEEDYNDQQEDETIFTEPQYNNDDTPFNDGIPDVNQDVGVLKRSFAKDKRDFLGKELNIFVRKGSGPNSKLLFNSINITMNNKENVNGLEYKGVKIILWNKSEGRFIYSDAVTKQDAINEFKELVQKAEYEYKNSVASRVESDIQAPLANDDTTRSIKISTTI